MADKCPYIRGSNINFNAFKHILYLKMKFYTIINIYKLFWKSYKPKIYLTLLYPRRENCTHLSFTQILLIISIIHNYMPFHIIINISQCFWNISMDKIYLTLFYSRAGQLDTPAVHLTLTVKSIHLNAAMHHSMPFYVKRRMYQWLWNSFMRKLCLTLLYPRKGYCSHQSYIKITRIISTLERISQLHIIYIMLYHNEHMSMILKFFYV